MDRGLYLAASGMLAEQLRQDQIANDLSNSSTSGYKAERTTQQSFGKLLLTNSVTGASIGSQSTGVQVTDTVTDWTPQAHQGHGRAARHGHQRRRLLRRADRGRRALHAQRRVPVRRAGPPRDRDGRPGPRPQQPAGQDRRRRQGRSSQPQRRPPQQPGEGRQQLHHRHARCRRRPGRGLGPRGRPRGLRRRCQPGHGGHDRLDAGLRGRPEGHPHDRRDARQGRVLRRVPQP